MSQDDYSFHWGSNEASKLYPSGELHEVWLGDKKIKGNTPKVIRIASKAADKIHESHENAWGSHWDVNSQVQEYREKIESPESFNAPLPASEEFKNEFGQPRTVTLDEKTTIVLGERDRVEIGEGISQTEDQKTENQEQRPVIASQSHPTAITDEITQFIQAFNEYFNKDGVIAAPIPNSTDRSINIVIYQLQGSTFNNPVSFNGQSTENSEETTMSPDIYNIGKLGTIHGDNFGDVGDKILQVLNSKNDKKLEKIIEQLDELLRRMKNEPNPDTETYRSCYKKFVSILADHTTVLQPILGGLLAAIPPS